MEREAERLVASSMRLRETSIMIEEGQSGARRRGNCTSHAEGISGGRIQTTLHLSWCAWPTRLLGEIHAKRRSLPLSVLGHPGWPDARARAVGGPGPPRRLPIRAGSPGD